MVSAPRAGRGGGAAVLALMGGAISEDPREVGRGAHLAFGALGVLARGRQRDDPLPASDRLAIALLLHEQCPLVKERSDVRWVETQHAGEGRHGVALATDGEERLTQRDERIEVVR